MIANSYTLYTPLEGMFVSPNPDDIIRFLEIEKTYQKAKPREVIYLAGPMSGIVQFNHPAFHAAAAALRNHGRVVVNPAELNPDTSKTWDECMRRDIKALSDCTTLALLPRWELSKGARLEFDIAQALGMTIIFLEAYPQLLTNQPATEALTEELSNAN